MIARTLITIGVLLVAIDVSAQAVDPYLQLLRMYRTDPAPATVSMARLSSDAIDAGVRRCVPDDPSKQPACQGNDVLAGAMLHLDAAELVLSPNSEAALRHIRAGQSLLLGPAGLDGGHPKAREHAVFARRWYALAARLLLAHSHNIAANAILTEGRTRYKESPEFFVVLGLVSEWRAGIAGVGWLASDLRGAAVRGQRLDQLQDLSPFAGSVLERVESASAHYRRALTLDPVFAGARVRLAWLHMLRGDERVWEAVSTEFLETADAEVRQLARLIRGTAAEHARKPEVALSEYREARRAAPDSQTACLAVSTAQALNGDFAGADATAAECLAIVHGSDHADPWTLFRMGLMDATTTRWLHDEARRR